MVANGITDLDLAAWARAPVRHDEKGLWIGTELVEESWEKPALQQMVRDAFSEVGFVSAFELGYGDGCASDEILRHMASNNYTCWELNEVLAETARDRIGSRGRVVQGAWQDYDGEGRADVVIADTYRIGLGLPIHEELIPQLHRFLNKGGCAAVWCKATRDWNGAIEKFAARYFIGVSIRTVECGNGRRITYAVLSNARTN